MQCDIFNQRKINKGHHDPRLSAPLKKVARSFQIGPQGHKLHQSSINFSSTCEEAVRQDQNQEPITLHHSGLREESSSSVSDADTVDTVRVDAEATTCMSSSPTGLLKNRQHQKNYWKIVTEGTGSGGNSVEKKRRSRSIQFTLSSPKRQYYIGNLIDVDVLDSTCQPEEQSHAPKKTRTVLFEDDV